MWQLAKELESSKATEHHIKQVAGDPQTAQINLLRHQCTELPASKYKKKRTLGKPKQTNHKPQSGNGYKPQALKRRGLIPRGCTMTKADVPNVVTQSTRKDSNVQLRSINVKLAISLGTLQVCAIRRNRHTPNQRDPRYTSYKQVQCMHVKVHHMTTWMTTALQKTHSACKWGSNTIKQKNNESQGGHIWLPIWLTEYNCMTIEIYIWEPGSTPVLMSTWCQLVCINSYSVI